jgi:hypothetical protein
MTKNKGTVALDRNGNYEGHAFNLAMLQAKLSGNHIKVMLAYMNIGGFNPNDSVFLTRKDYTRFGFVRQTLYTLPPELVEAGWLIKCDRRSKADYEYYYVAVGGPIAKRAKKGVTNSDRRVSENMTRGCQEMRQGGVTITDIELSTDLSTELPTDRTNYDEPATAAPSGAQGAPVQDRNRTNRNDQPTTLIGDTSSIDQDLLDRVFPVSSNDLGSLLDSVYYESSPIGKTTAEAGGADAAAGITKAAIDIRVLKNQKDSPRCAAMTPERQRYQAECELKTEAKDAAREAAFRARQPKRESLVPAGGPELEW